MRNFLIPAVAMLFASTSVWADEPSVQQPRRLSMDFEIANGVYNVTISARTVTISCGGKVVGRPSLDSSPTKIEGTIIGIELGSTSTRHCTSSLYLGLITRDFSRPGDETLTHYELSVDDTGVVTSGRTSLGE
jgi:hypothetical protein